tara:strand:- start:1392 stop:2039 length:648 start_codon:yes stop_codon:yes gene_type:complete
MSLSPTTELEAINTMLTSIGEQPVIDENNLAGLADASIAKDILSNTSRAVQSRGWIFNTDLDVEMSPDNTKRIKIPSNVIRVDTTTRLRTSTEDIVERAGYLYDRKNNTDNFVVGTKIKVNRIVLLKFEELPEPARRYISIRSARIFHDRVVGSGELHRFFQEDELQAWGTLIEYEGDVSDYNIFDNYDVFRVLDRLPGTTSNRLGYNVIDSSTT